MAVSSSCGAGLARYASAAQHGADSPERVEAPYGAAEDDAAQNAKSMHKNASECTSMRSYAL